MKELPDDYFTDNIVTHLQQTLILLEECPSYPLAVKRVTRRALEDAIARLRLCDFDRALKEVVMQ